MSDQNLIFDVSDFAGEDEGDVTLDDTPIDVSDFAGKDEGDVTLDDTPIDVSDFDSSTDVSDLEKEDVPDIDTEQPTDVDEDDKRDSSLLARMLLLGPVGFFMDMDSFYREGTDRNTGVSEKGARELLPEDIEKINVAAAERKTEREAYAEDLTVRLQEEKDRITSTKSRLQDTIDEGGYTAGYAQEALKKLHDDEMHVDDLLERSNQPYKLGVSGLDFHHSIHPSRNMFRPSKDGLRMLSTNEEFLRDFIPYVYDRWGPEEAKMDGETMEEFVQRGMSLWRWEITNSVSGANGLFYLLKNTDDPEQLERMKRIQLTLENDEIVPPMFDRGFGETINAAQDYLLAGASDPLTYASLGIGKMIGIAGQKAVQKWAMPKMTNAFLNNLTTPSIIALTAGEGAVFADLEQRREILANVRGEGPAQQEGETEEEFIARGGQEYDPARTATMAAVTGVVGGPLAAMGVRQVGKNRFWNRKTSEVYKQRNQAEVQRKVTQQNVDDATENVIEGEQEQIKFNQRAQEALNQGIIDGEVPPTDILAAQLRLDIAKNMTEVAKNILRAYDEDASLDISDIVDFDKQAMEQIQDITNKILKGGDDINIDALDRAVKETGMTVPEYIKFLSDGITGRGGPDAGDLALAQRTATSEAGSRLRETAGTFADLVKKFKEIDPRVADEIEKIFGVPNKTERFASRAMRIGHRIMDEGIAIVVSGPATAIRNTASGVSLITFGTAANLIETSLYHTGKAYTAAVDGRASLKGVQLGLADMVKDTFGSINLLLDPKYAKEISDFALRSNPRLNRVISRSLQETGEKNLSAFARYVNVFNLIGDVYIRRAVFGASVDQQLRRGASAAQRNISDEISKLSEELLQIGVPLGDNSRTARQTILKRIAKLRQRKESPMTLAEIVSSGKNVPLKPLERGVQEALKVTMAYKPRAQIKGGAQTVGEGLETVGGAFVDLVNKQGTFGAVKLPLPFSKFMVNAMAWQLRHTAPNQVAGMFNMVSELSSAYNKSWKKGRLLKDKINVSKEIDQAEMTRARRQFAEGTVGIAALTAAVYERANNQDIPFRYSRVFSEVLDTTVNYPYNFMKSMADVIVKIDLGMTSAIDYKEIGEAVTNYAGRSRLAGGQVFDGIFDYVTGKADIGGTAMEELGIAVAKVMAAWAGRYTTYGRIGADVNRAYDDEAAKIRDLNQRDFAGSSGGLDMFIAQLKDEVGNMFPDFLSSTSELPQKYDAVKGAKVRKDVGFPLKHVSGAIRVERPDTHDGELSRFGLESWKVYRPSGPGLGEWDNEVRKEMSMIIPERVKQLMQSRNYRGATQTQKEIALRATVTDAKTDSIDKAAATLGGISNIAIARTKFKNTLSKLEQKGVNELFLQNNSGTALEGKTIEQVGTAEAYLLGIEFKDQLEIFKY